MTKQPQQQPVHPRGYQQAQQPPYQQGGYQQGGFQPGGYPQRGAGPAGSDPNSPWTPQDPYAKSRLAAGLLGIFVGGLGIHRFYLGYVGIGVLQIVATVVTFGAASLWGFIEGILYLTAKQGNYSRDATGRPLRD